MTSPGDNSDWFSVDDGDVGVERLRRIGLVLGGQEERRQNVFLKCLPVVQHVDVTDHRHRHPQVPACQRTQATRSHKAHVSETVGGRPDV